MERNVSIVIPALNEAKIIGHLVQGLKTWNRVREIIVVANGCTDSTAVQARGKGARVIEIPVALGHDVGRCIGIRAAQSDIVLVIDGDMTYSIDELTVFVDAVSNGVDIALNQYPLCTSPWFHHPTAVSKNALNLFLNRPDLKASSLTSIPHALSRKAIQAIGWKQFCVPPVAQAIAVLNGLRVEAVGHIPVVYRNPVRCRSGGASVQRLIIGDCLEAVHYVLQQRGPRGGFADSTRRRDVFQTLKQRNAAASGETFSALAVVPAFNDQDTIDKVLCNIQGTTTEAICVVNNGSQDASSALAHHEGVLVENFDEALGHDVGRAVGCMMHRAKKYLFTDADIPIPSEHIQPFLDGLDDTDIALNQLHVLLPLDRQVDETSIVKRFLNLALDRADLGLASMTAIPHALTHEVIEAIGGESLMVPPLAFVKASLLGFRSKAIYPVDVVKTNKYRASIHSRKRGTKIARLIIGDHLEAIHYMFGQLGPRGFYPDGMRKRQFLETWKEPTITISHHESTARPKIMNGAWGPRRKSGASRKRRTQPKVSLTNSIGTRHPS